MSVSVRGMDQLEVSVVMKRLVAMAVIAMLVAAFGMPAAALAKRGNGPKSGKVPPGLVVQSEADPVEESGDDVDTPDEPADEAAEPKGKALGHAKRAERAGENGEDGEKLTGIENAASRIAANIAKSERKMAEGRKKHVPGGLLATFAKFAEWIAGGGAPDTGDEPADEPADEPGEDIEEPGETEAGEGT